MKPIKIAHKIYSLFWRILKPQTAGARAILIKDEKILLVKHTYLNSWFLPGGGLKSNETYEQAIRRELEEELGITVSDLKLHGIYNNFYESKNDSIVVFSSLNFTEPNNKDGEIEDFGFFGFDELPQNISPGTRRRIEEFQNSDKPNFGIW